MRNPKRTTEPLAVKPRSRLMRVQVAMAQINSTVGDLKGNSERIKHYVQKAKEKAVDLVVFPELAITGYPPQDLLYENNFVQENKAWLNKIVEESRGITIVVGFVDFDPKIRGSDGTEVKYNAAAVMRDGRLVGVQYKTLLPTYDVFDEDRYFAPAVEHRVFDVKGVKFGVEICEDLWDESYDVKVTKILVDKGAQFILNLSASPFYAGKRLERQRLLCKQARNNKVPIFYVNAVGGQDELVFDGQSLAVDKTGKLIALGKQFEEDLTVTEIDPETKLGKKVKAPKYNREAEIFNALVLGVRDYFRKTGFKKAVIGLSGGIDSSLVAVIATEALGKENVLGVSMPSRYSSQHSKEDARQLAENLGIPYKVIPIETVFKAFEETLREEFAGLERDVAEENIQARIRGMILMSLSNKFGYLVLSTGNKTELALGYSTLYGDMCGGLAAISDVSKTEVYALARYVNEKAGRFIIPKSSVEKIPSAELKEDQFDPFDYDVISPLVDEIIENRRGKKGLIQMGYKKEDVAGTMKRVKTAEYKRRQAPPGIKITRKAFGIGRKMPIVNRYLSKGFETRH